MPQRPAAFAPAAGMKYDGCQIGVDVLGGVQQYVAYLFRGVLFDVKFKREFYVERPLERREAQYVDEPGIVRIYHGASAKNAGKNNSLDLHLRNTITKTFVPRFAKKCS